jgi:acetyl-CoA acyltransferase
VDLYALTLKELMKRVGNKVKADQIEDVITGCVSPVNEQGANIGRLGLLKAGFPVTVPGIQLNRMCGSGQQAIHFGAQAIASGDMELVIAGGVEMMSTVPMASDSHLLDMVPDPKTAKFIQEFPHPLLNQGISAELIAEKYKIAREEMEELAAESHERFAKAVKAGYFKSQTFPVPKADGKGFFTEDECYRVPVDRKKFAELKPVFKENGRITAALSSQITDGAAAVLLCSGKKAKELGLKRRARIVARAVVGSDVELMLTGPIPATRKVLEMSGLTIDDIDHFEINEAFASVVLAWMKELKIPKHKVNPNGGAIAHGHPLGATGAILMTKMINELERTNTRFALLTICIGHGQATATIIERVQNHQSKL